MRRARPSALALLLAMLGVGPQPAEANGKRDLDDGIAFYENLDTERAIDRLQSATQAKDLSDSDRAKAFLYLGIVKYEVGREAEADTAWKQAFSLNASIPAPSGTSPKVIQAMDRLRAKAGAKPPEPVPTPPVPPVGTQPGEPKAVPGVEPPAEKPPLTEAPPPPSSDDDGSLGWLLWGGVGVAAVGAAVVTILLVSGGGPCKGGFGCAVVSVR